MHSSTLRRVALGCALAIVLALPATASATSVGANLRVEAPNGKVLADVTQYTSPATVKTDPKARCFGAGSGGTGNRVKIPNPTALGLVADALPHVPALRPLSVTDAFAFGLGVCGIGGRLGGHPDPFWDLFRNNVAAQVGGDQLKVHDGDRILWYLAPSFPVGKELSLRLPLHATPGAPVMASVVAYSDDGTVTPAAGAIVSHASAPTDASGHTSVVLPSGGTFRVQARRGGDIPSNVRVVCTTRRTSACGIQKRIYGSPGADRITTTSGNNLVVAGAGGDRITAKLHGGADRIRCGPGRDVVVRDRRDHNERIARSCERVIRK